MKEEEQKEQEVFSIINTNFVAKMLHFIFYCLFSFSYDFPPFLQYTVVIMQTFINPTTVGLQ